jgi:hypothetical protein
LSQFEFDATVIYWRGPSPYFYAPIPQLHVEDIRRASKVVSYGWGAIPVEAEIGSLRFTTSLFPKDGGYLLPIKTVVRDRSGVTAGDAVHIGLTIKPRR